MINALLEKITFKPDDQKLLVLSGMSAAMGSLFPTPVLGVLLIHELGNPPKSFMESTLLLSVAAVASFLVFFALEPFTFTEVMKATVSGYVISAVSVVGF